MLLSSGVCIQYCDTLDVQHWNNHEPQCNLCVNCECRCGTLTKAGLLVKTGMKSSQLTRIEQKIIEAATLKSTTLISCSEIPNRTTYLVAFNTASEY